MYETDLREVARMMIGRHGRGASLLAYEHVVRTVASRDRLVAENWCRVLIAVEEELTQT